jgi:hypothetical protein
LEANNESVLGRGGDFYKGLFWKNGSNSDFEENKSEIVKFKQYRFQHVAKNIARISEICLTFLLLWTIARAPTSQFEKRTLPSLLVVKPKIQAKLISHSLIIL